MFYPGQKITIASTKLGRNIIFEYCATGRIESSWKKQTDTLQLTMPRRLTYKGQLLQDLITVGDRITVDVGYDGELKREFAGFLSRVDAKVPLGIYAEDNMWAFKKGSITKAWSSANLKTVVKYLVDHYNTTYGHKFTFNAVDADLGALRLKDATGSLALAKIREIYGMVAYFRGDELNVGFPRGTGTNSADATRVKYRFTYNIISSDLMFRTKDEIRVKIRAISNRIDNKKDTVEVGDPEGEVHTRNFFNVSKEKLKTLAETELANARFDGYQGTFRSFGIPEVAHGDVAVLEDPDYPEREGAYFVDSVTTEFGTKGFKRIVELGQKAS